MQDFKNKNVAIIGGAGFVGSNLARALLSCSPNRILVIDNLLSSERESVPDLPLLDFVTGSITDDRILRKLDDDLDYIFHLATYHGNQNSICNPLEDHKNNTLTTLKLYEKIKTFKRIKKVVYSSAGCTVAKKTYETACATTEDEPVSLYLDSPYQISKIIGEFYSNYYFKQYGLPVVKARFQNVYGPGEILGAGKWRGTPATVWRNVIPTFIYRALKHMALTIESGGVATRDFIYVDDIARGLMLCALRGQPGEVYNLASGIETSIIDLANLINTLTGNITPPTTSPARDWDRSGKRFGSTDKAKRELRFEAEISLADGLAATTDWTKNHLKLIETCINKHQRFMSKPA